MRRADHVERLDDDHWRVPKDLVERGMAYDADRGGSGIAVRTLSTLDLEGQVGSEGATWLDRELIAREPTPIVHAGFGRDVSDALDRRANRLVEMGHAVADPNGTVRFPRNLVPALERQEVERVGKELAKARGLTFQQTKTGDYVSGTLAGSTQLASGRYAMIESCNGDGGFGFSLVPWQPALDQRIGRHVTGIMRNGGGIEWDFGRKRGLGL